MLASGGSKAGAAELSARIGRSIPVGYWIAYLTIVGVSVLSSLILLWFGRTHPLPPPTGGSSFPFVTFSLTILFVIAVVRPLLLVIRRHPAPTRQLIADVQRHKGWLVTVGLMAIVLPHTLDTATRFKQLIPQLVPFYADHAIANFEHRLLGVDAWKITHAVIGAEATRAIDLVYGLWHLVNISLLCWMVLTRDRRYQIQAVLTYQLAWLLLGGAAAIGLASVGPCFLQAFTGDPRFAPLMAQLRAVNGPEGLNSLVAMKYLLANVDRNALGAGISAMPSLHVGIAVFAVLVAFRQTRRMWMRAIALAYAAVIYVGSIHLGWHYASDGIVGGAGMALIWLACGRFADLACVSVLEDQEPAASTGTDEAAELRQRS
jgi:hypothetical protein